MENQNNNISNQGYPQQYFQELKNAIDSLDQEKIHKVTSVLFEAYKQSKTIFILGNGGSASTASHLAEDWGKSTIKNFYDEKEKRFKVISLTDNVAFISALGNDLSFEDIFVQQLGSLVNKGDVVVAISGSGNSPNIIKAVEYAEKCGAITVGFLGRGNGGKLGPLVDYSVIVLDNHQGRIEDIHMVLGHLITDSLRELKKREIEEI
ncbi:MAG: SIS domain-containing protein [bacterium]|nr:SIS domain-containing protein [bacterium]